MRERLIRTDKLWLRAPATALVVALLVAVWTLGGCVSFSKGLSGSIDGDGVAKVLDSVLDRKAAPKPARLVITIDAGTDISYSVSAAHVGNALKVTKQSDYLKEKKP